MLQVPTDRLYKFFAVLGLAIAVAGGSVFYTQLEKKKENEGLLVRLEDELAFKTNLMKLSQSQHDEAFDRLKEKYKQGIPLTDEDKTGLTDLGKKFESDVDTYKAFIGGIVSKIKEARLHQRYSAYFFGISGACLLGGLVLSFFGFRAWLRAEGASQAKPDDREDA